MDDIKKKVRALGLCSGGLDSQLAGLVLRSQGIEVHWISFETPFFSADKAKRAADQLGIPLIVENITEIYLPMLKNPPCGYGKNMNPCLDCHSLMFRLAGERMKTDGFDFLFSGEVVGQRPMSQTKPSLRYVEKHSGYDGYIIRPLSAKLLPESIPEKEGLVDRSRLLDLSGRGRKSQMKLAEEFNITDYPAPAGGCLLTDKVFSDRLRELFDHDENPSESSLHLLKCGRHFRLPGGAKIIVGRQKADNLLIQKYYDPAADTLIRLYKKPGPLVLVQGVWDDPVIRLAGAIAVGYSKAPKDSAADVQVASPDGTEVIRVLGLRPEDVKRLLI
jgi:tRNA U34 2-thiouridine synthase MnmA/TrmU